MLHSYDIDEVMPEYADDRYEGCLDGREARILRLVLSYCEYVELRYGTPEVLYTTFRPDKKGKSLRTSRNFQAFEKIIDQLGGADPAHFMSYVFETWKGREHYGKYASSKSQFLTKTPGITYPSMKYIIQHTDRLVEEFLAIPDYEPRGFTTSDERKKRYLRAMQDKVDRWVGIYADEGKTEQDYWRLIQHLVPPHLNYPDIPYAESLHRNEDIILEEFEFSVAELTEYLAYLWQTPVQLPIIRIPNEEWMDDYALERISRTEDALSNGTDVTTDSFQQELEESINPIDSDHPDTVMYYLFGEGKPRRENN
jgi:hypothetical protein